MSEVTRFPTASSNDFSVGTLSWSNPTNAEITDNVYAVCLYQSNSQSLYLKVKSFGFEIPEGATINGITVHVLCKTESGPGGAYCASAKIVNVDIIQNVVEKGGTYIYIPEDLSTINFGSSTDLWGISWTPAEINNDGFGFVFSVGFGSSAVFVDSISITVDYTLPSPIKTVNGVPLTSIKSKNGILISSIKSWNGLA